MSIATEMKELTQHIASSHEDRAKQIKEIKGEAKQAIEEAERLIKSFQTSRRQVSIRLRKDLGRETAHRKSGVKRMLGDTQGLVKGFHSLRREEDARMRKELAQGVAELRSEVNRIVQDAQQTIVGFGLYRKGMSKKLRKELARTTSRTKTEVVELLGNAQNLLQDFRRAQAEVRADLKEAAMAWQELTHLVPAKRAKIKVLPKAEVVIAGGGTPNLEARLLAAIKEHPNGITLVKVADNLGVASIVLGRTSKSLLEKGKIRKEDKLYFPVVS